MTSTYDLTATLYPCYVSDVASVGFGEGPEDLVFLYLGHC